MYSIFSFQGRNTKDNLILIKQRAIQCEKLNVYSILNQYYNSNLRADVFLERQYNTDSIIIQCNCFNLDSTFIQQLTFQG